MNISGLSGFKVILMLLATKNHFLHSKARVLVLIESTPVIEKSKNDKYKPDRMSGHIKRIVINDLKANSTNEKVKNTTEGILGKEYSIDFLLHVLKWLNYNH
jgi:uncharacterized protein YaiL (DUF2058 family)